MICKAQEPAGFSYLYGLFDGTKLPDGLNKSG
jgi:hypothetical protein